MTLEVLDCIINTFDDIFDDENESYTVVIYNGDENEKQKATIMDKLHPRW